MTATTVELRDEVYVRILLKKTNLDYIINDFDLEKTWMPYERLESLAADHPNGKLYVIGLAPGDADNRSRTNLSQRTTNVMLGYQRANVDPQDQTLIDDLVELVEQLDRTLIHEVFLDRYSFSSLEYMKDENDVPFSFMGLRNTNIFEAYFIAHFQRVLEPTTT